MSQDDIFERFELMERRIARLLGDRLTRADMCARLGVSGKTLTDRVRRSVVPTPCTDGKWLLSEVLDWESREASRNVGG